jgi:co-chaperonin GroES (HSP10)
MSRELILIGDKVLIEPDVQKGKTEGGLYLPQGVSEKERVRYGRIVKTGPGHPVIDPSALNAEPWVESGRDHYFPLQAKVGDHCIFLRDQAVEIRYDKKKFFVAPHNAILLLIRAENNLGGVTIQ